MSSIVVQTILIVLVVIAIACSKSGNARYPDRGLPAITSEGKNTFACRINGHPWISQEGRPDMAALLLQDTLYAKGTLDSTNTSEIIQIVLFGSYKATQASYVFNDTTTAYGLYIKFGASDCFANASGFGDMVSKKNANGHLMISRADDKIVAGQFDFFVVTDYCDTLKITDGRFDIQYQY